MIPLTVAFFLILGLLLLAFFAGTLVRHKWLPADAKKSTFFIEGTLLFLLISFTFSVAASKYDTRRSIFTEEINAISTTILRMQLYPDSMYSRFKPLMTQYLLNRIAYYEVRSEQARIDSLLAVEQEIALKIFQIIKSEVTTPYYLPLTQQIIPAANNMLDLSTTREINRRSIVSLSIIRLLFVLSLIVGFSIGLNQEKGKSNWFAAFGYAVLLSMSFALILDFNDDRSGNITLDAEQQILIALQQLL